MSACRQPIQNLGLRRESKGAVREDTLHMSTVKDVERLVKREGNVLTIRAGETVVAAARKMRDHHVGCLVVLDNVAIVGILTERDIINKVLAAPLDPAVTRVADVMTRSIVSCRLDTSVSQARHIMAAHGIRHLPIMEDGMPVGMISSRDILCHELTKARAIVARQSRLLHDLERAHPGISQLRRDPAGRVVI